MSENELRDALAALASPTQPPPGASTRIHAGVRRRGRRRFLGLAGAVTTAVVITAAGTWWSGPSDPPATTPTEPRPSIELTETTAPLDAPGCPPQGAVDWESGAYEVAYSPETRTTRSRRLPDLADVTSVRLCSVWEIGSRRPKPTVAADPEALVFGIDLLAQRLLELGPEDEDRCILRSMIPMGPDVVFTRRDGSRVAVTGAGCADVYRGRTLLDGGSVSGAVLSLLDRQRDAYAYRPADTPAPGCTDLVPESPFRPGRDRIVSATLCGRYDEETGYPARALDGDDLDRLADAFDRAAPREMLHGDDACAQYDEELGLVLARTDRGDTIRLAPSPCGVLHIHGLLGSASPSWTVPIDFEELEG